MQNQSRAFQKFKTLKKTNDLLEKRKTFFENEICFEKSF